MRDVWIVDLPDDIRERTDRLIIQDIRDTVLACADRDYDSYMLRQQLEGISVPASDGGPNPNTNGCVIEDTISREMHTTAMANVMSAFRQKPYVTCEALDPVDDPIVQRLETLGNVEAELYGFDSALSGMTYNAFEGRYAVCSVMYSTTRSKSKTIEAAPQISLDGEEPLLPGPPTLYQENNVTEAFEFNVPESWDFYLSPVGAQEVQKADRTIERLWLTPSALMDGLRDEGFLEKETRKLLSSGPTAVSDGFSPRHDQMQLQGIREDKAGFYECYRVIGRMPPLLNSQGVPETPERFLDEDFLWLVCPDHNIVFKRTYSSFPLRPYVLGKALGAEGQMIGHGIVSLCSAVQDEMTIMLRAIIDSTNYTMNPRVKIPMQLEGWYSQHDWRNPGNYCVYQRDPNEVTPMTQDFAGLNLGIEVTQMLYNRCVQMVAAQGVNSNMGGKVRRAAEVDFTTQVIQNKFGLMLSNLQRMVEEVFRIYFSLRQQHMDAEVTARQGNQSVTVTKDDLGIPFRIIPHADADNASSQLRLQNDVALNEYLQTNPIYMAMVQRGDFSAAWMLGYRILSHMGIRNPEAFLGPQPTPGDAVSILNAIQPIVLQGAQMQDPVAMSIIQVVKQLMQQNSNAGPHAGQQNPLPGTGISIPSMPMQQAGPPLGQVASRMNGVGH